ncbi:GGDEF domain-containing protein [Devosia sp. CN2-171]|uniref:GGDEF domain-containing protein n=1 Tax=Devosia sp. CN2-171 TaxID=3400909 RepID=UPI003BF7FCBB
MNKVRLTRVAWAGVWRRTLGILALSTLGSWVVSELIMFALGQGMNDVGMVLALSMPTVLGGPILFYLQIKSAQLSEANRRLETLASTDWLTGVLNRRSFTSQVGRALDRNGGGALLVLDADHFKTINDRFGHERGDEVLQMLAGAIRDGVRENDFVGRLGGEEFGVFLHGAGFESAWQTAERIRTGVNALFVTSEGVAQRLSVSIGGAVAGADSSFSQLFRSADERLYSAKHAGRNRVELGGSLDEEAVAALTAAIS